MIDDELTLATAYVDTRRWRQALEVLRSVISRSPEDPYALCLIAHCHLGLQDPEPRARGRERRGRCRTDGSMGCPAPVCGAPRGEALA